MLLILNCIDITLIYVGEMSSVHESGPPGKHSEM